MTAIWSGSTFRRPARSAGASSHCAAGEACTPAAQMTVAAARVLPPRLKVNEAKSAVARPEERKFLGFSISNDGSERRIAPKALDKFKGQIRDMTRRTRGFGLQQLIKELKPYILGWRGYFGFCQISASPHEPRSVDPSKIAFVSLAAVANRAKPLQRTMPSWHIEVQCGGGGRLALGPLAARLRPRKAHGFRA